MASKKLASCIIAVGWLGFLAPVWMQWIPGELLDGIELPNALWADRLTAPDGRVFIVSSPNARVQRYGPEGFEKGFMYRRKAFKFGLSESGDILICAAGGELLTYNPDGAELPPRGSCSRDHRFDVSTSSHHSNAKVPAIACNLFLALAVPLWHPVVAWVVSLFGFLLLKLSSPPSSDPPD